MVSREPKPITQMKYMLTPQQIEMLEQIPGWKWDPPDNNWFIKCQALKAFVEEKGRYPSNYSKVLEEKILAHWASEQRRRKKIADRQA